MRIILLICVAAMGVAEQESRASERAMDGAHSTDTLRKSDTELWIPKIIRDDLRAKATDFVTRVFPNIDDEWLAFQMKNGFGPDTRIDIQAGTWRRPTIRIGEQPLLEMFLPDARYMVLFPYGIIGETRYVVPPGVEVDTPDDHLTLQDAEVRAREVLVRLVGDPDRARQMTTRRSRELRRREYAYLAFREARKDQLWQLGLSIDIAISLSDGAVRTVKLSKPVASPQVSPADAATVAQTTMKRPGQVDLHEIYHAGMRQLVWRYLVPPEPGGGPEDTTYWDANTGELLYSHVLRGGTEREPYRNPAFFVEVTDELVMRNVEKMLLDRATELKRQAKDRPDANKP